MVIALAHVVVGWDISNQIIDGLRARPEQADYDTDVLAVEAGEIRLRRSPDDPVAADRDAVMGLAWEGGYARIGPASSSENAVETRSFELIHGSPPPLGDQLAEVDADAFPADPADAGIDYEPVSYPAPRQICPPPSPPTPTTPDVGQPGAGRQGCRYDAWRLDGRGATWLIGVHGRGADRAELLRLVQATDDLDYPTLIPEYRNDPGAPGSAGSLLLGGQNAWRDVAAAADYALAHGASDVVLYGASMGGALSLGYLLEARPEAVRGVILEAPAADLRQTITLRSDEALPFGGPLRDSLVGTGRAIVWLRTGLDFDTVDYVDRADELSTPVLVFHGTEDETVPFEVGRSLARARPELIEFQPVEDAAHVRAWNEDPDGYGATVARFLDRIGRSGQPSRGGP